MKSLRRKRRGFTLLELLIVLEIIIILAALAIPNLLQSRDAANETAALGAMRTINGAEANYRTRFGAYGTLSALATGSLIDPALGNASSSATLRSGYYFNITVVSTNKTQYFVTASPAPNAGTRVFYTDETGVVFAAPSATTLPVSDASGVLTAMGTGWVLTGN